MNNDPETRSSDACPEPETLATFLDGRLAEGERDTIAAHLTTCEACYAVVLAASQTTAGIVDFLPAPFRSSPRARWAALAGLAAVAALAIAVILRGGIWRASPDVELQRALVAAVGHERRIEPRLSGGFAYAPIHVLPSLPSSDIEAPSLAVRIAASRIEQDKAAEDTTRALHLRGIATLLMGDLDMAIVFLEQAAGREPDNAQVQNDLATAYLVRAKRTREQADVSRALSTADRAIDADQSLAEARFNRAYALELLGMPDEARAAWESYLALDDRSGWADEARARLRELTQR